MEGRNDDRNDIMLLAGNVMAVFNNNLIDWNDFGLAEHEERAWEKVTVNIDEFLFFNDSAFRLHFCMNWATFEALVHAVGNYIHEEQRVRRNPDLHLSHILLSVLWVLATPDSFRSIALRFGLTPGVLHFRVISPSCSYRMALPEK